LTSPFFYAVGDIAPDREVADECFALIHEELARAEFVFAQLETSYTRLGTRLPQARHAVRARPEDAAALRRANIGVISCAGNHCMDWGREALLDTIGHLGHEGIAVVGAGEHIAAARRPVIRSAAGVRVGFLAYSSILPQNYWAEERRAGCAPMRAWTHYEQIEHDQPGTPARIHTFAHRDDLKALQADVAGLRAQADLVVVSMHWGIHFVPAVIADYQREVGRAVIDAGADAVIGHHAHLLKGAELHAGRPILYSIGNFAVDLRMDAAHAASPGFREIQKLNPNWVPDFGSLYNFPDESRLTVMVRIGLGAAERGALRLRPACINRQAQPRLLAPHEPEFEQVCHYLNEACAKAELNGEFVIDGGELHLREVTR
jgi:poly-gamma-glutamate capsule biosynthesis protein CapA/YwtB (metallophosphatase superfamily)